MAATTPPTPGAPLRWDLAAPPSQGTVHFPTSRIRAGSVTALTSRTGNSASSRKPAVRWEGWPPSDHHAGRGPSHVEKSCVGICPQPQLSSQPTSATSRVTGTPWTSSPAEPEDDCNSSRQLNASAWGALSRSCLAKLGRPRNHEIMTCYFMALHLAVACYATIIDNQNSGVGFLLWWSTYFF